MAEKAQVTKRSRSSVGNRSDSFFPAAQHAGTGSVARKRAGRSGPVQGGLTVSAPSDPLEKQAEHTADTVLRMPVGPVQRSSSAASEIQQATEEDALQRSPSAEEQVQRSPAAAVASLRDRHGPVSPAELRAATAGGQPVPATERAELEPRLGVSLADIRLHTDAEAGRLSRRLRAKAFTHRGHVFFAPGQFRPGTAQGRHLLAHELTHTIQQGAATPLAPGAAAPAYQHATTPRPPGAAAPRARGASGSRGPSRPTPSRSGPRGLVTSAVPHLARTHSRTLPDVQRFGLDTVKDYFAESADHIPGYRMLTLALGIDPISGAEVERTGANILRALVELVPAGTLITQALDAHGLVESTALWIQQRLGGLEALGSSFVAQLDRFFDELGFGDLASPSAVWKHAQGMVLRATNAVIDTCAELAVDIYELVKAAVLPPVAAWAAETRGYPLLTALLGVDPISGKRVEPTPEVLIGGFMTLIGQGEIWDHLQEANAVERAWAWFHTAQG
ncbi:MAG: DUF4157 domain-containing protein, partial [Brachybacterium sp.]|nr:DUF4157 domain-containing protein [Brachybacterium sp.]